MARQNDLPRDGDTDVVRLAGERLTFTFDAKAAKRAVDFFPTHLRFFKGPRHLVGKPFVLAPWEHRVVWNIFGWKREDGTRRYRSAFVGIPRKNGKSHLGAGLALLLLTADGEPGAEIYGAACDREQAKLIWDIAKQFVLRDPDLRARLDVLDSSKRIIFRDPITYGPGFYEAIPADASGALGFNASAVIVDELLTQPNRKLVDALTTSVGARDQPLTVYFTTAGFDEETICGEEWDRARQVIDGKIADPYHYCVIFAADERDDPHSPETWKKANPGWDHMGPQWRAFIKEEARKAQMVPAFLNPFKMYHLNIWTKQSIRWMPMADWDRCNGLMPDDLTERDCWLGVSIWDAAKMAAAVLVFAPKEQDDTGTYDILATYWMPRHSIDQDDKMRDTYLSWEAEAYLRVHEGSALDVGALRTDVLAMLSKYQVRGMVGDRSAMFYLEQEIAEAGVPTDRMNHSTADMSAPTKDLLRLVMLGRLRHAGNPILRWNADNVTVLADTSGEIRPSRTKSAKSIEGVCALVMGVWKAIPDRQAPADHGVVFIA